MMPYNHIGSLRAELFGIGGAVPANQRHAKNSNEGIARLALLVHSSPFHFICEILQNISDAQRRYDCSPPITKCIFTLLLNDAFTTPPPRETIHGNLFVTYDEPGWLAKDVDAVVRARESTKSVKDGEYIGEKGQGFYSIFRVAAEAFVISAQGFKYRNGGLTKIKKIESKKASRPGGYFFFLSRSPCLDCHFKYVVPRWIDPKCLPTILLQLTEDKSTLALRLGDPSYDGNEKLTSNSQGGEDLLCQIRSTLDKFPMETLLFINSPSTIEIYVQASKKTNKFKKTLISRHYDSVISGTNKLLHWTVSECHIALSTLIEDGLFPSNTKSVASKNVDKVTSFSFLKSSFRFEIPESVRSVTASRPAATHRTIDILFPVVNSNDWNVYACLPVENERCPLKGIINCDFLLSASREQLDFSPESSTWNRFLLDSLPTAYSHALERLIESQYFPLFTRFLPDLANCKSGTESFNKVAEEIIDLLPSLQVIPCGWNKCKAQIPSDSCILPLVYVNLFSEAADEEEPFDDLLQRHGVLHRQVILACGLSSEDLNNVLLDIGVNLFFELPVSRIVLFLTDLLVILKNGMINATVTWWAAWFDFLSLLLAKYSFEFEKIRMKRYKDICVQLPLEVFQLAESIRFPSAEEAKGCLTNVSQDQASLISCLMSKHIIPLECGKISLFPYEGLLMAGQTAGSMHGGKSLLNISDGISRIMESANQCLDLPADFGIDTSYIKPRLIHNNLSTCHEYSGFPLNPKRSIENVSIKATSPLLRIGFGIEMFDLPGYCSLLCTLLSQSVFLAPPTKCLEKAVETNVRMFWNLANLIQDLQADPVIMKPFPRILEHLESKTKFRTVKELMVANIDFTVMLPRTIGTWTRMIPPGGVWPTRNILHEAYATLRPSSMSTEECRQSLHKYLHAIDWPDLGTPEDHRKAASITITESLCPDTFKPVVSSEKILQACGVTNFPLAHMLEIVTVGVAELTSGRSVSEECIIECLAPDWLKLQHPNFRVGSPCELELLENDNQTFVDGLKTSMKLEPLHRENAAVQQLKEFLGDPAVLELFIAWLNSNYIKGDMSDASFSCNYAGSSIHTHRTFNSQLNYFLKSSQWIPIVCPKESLSVPLGCVCSSSIPLESCWDSNNLRICKTPNISSDVCIFLGILKKVSSSSAISILMQLSETQKALLECKIALQQYSLLFESLIDAPASRVATVALLYKMIESEPDNFVACENEVVPIDQVFYKNPLVLLTCGTYVENQQALKDVVGLGLWTTSMKLVWEYNVSAMPMFTDCLIVALVESYPPQLGETLRSFFLSTLKIPKLPGITIFLQNMQILCEEIAQLCGEDPVSSGGDKICEKINTRGVVLLQHLVESVCESTIPLTENSSVVGDIFRAYPLVPIKIGSSYHLAHPSCVFHVPYYLDIPHNALESIVSNLAQCSEPIPQIAYVSSNPTVSCAYQAVFWELGIPSILMKTTFVTTDEFTRLDESHSIPNNITIGLEILALTLYDVNPVFAQCLEKMGVMIALSQCAVFLHGDKFDLEYKVVINSKPLSQTNGLLSDTSACLPPWNGKTRVTLEGTCREKVDIFFIRVPLYPEEDLEDEQENNNLVAMNEIDCPNGAESPMSRRLRILEARRRKQFKLKSNHLGSEYCRGQQKIGPFILQLHISKEFHQRLEKNISDVNEMLATSLINLIDELCTISSESRKKLFRNLMDGFDNYHEVSESLKTRIYGSTNTDSFSSIMTMFKQQVSKVDSPPPKKLKPEVKPSTCVWNEDTAADFDLTIKEIVQSGYEEVTVYLETKDFKQLQYKPIKAILRNENGVIMENIVSIQTPIKYVRLTPTEEYWIELFVTEREMEIFVSRTNFIVSFPIPLWWKPEKQIRIKNKLQLSWKPLAAESKIEFWFGTGGHQEGSFYRFCKENKSIVGGSLGCRMFELPSSFNDKLIHVKARSIFNNTTTTFSKVLTFLANGICLQQLQLPPISRNYSGITDPVEEVVQEENEASPTENQRLDFSSSMSVDESSSLLAFSDIKVAQYVMVKSNLWFTKDILVGHVAGFNHEASRVVLDRKYVPGAFLKAIGLNLGDDPFELFLLSNEDDSNDMIVVDFQDIFSIVALEHRLPFERQHAVRFHGRFQYSSTNASTFTCRYRICELKYKFRPGRMSDFDIVVKPVQTTLLSKKRVAALQNLCDGINCADETFHRSAADIFAGGGGTSTGLSKAGCELRWACERDHYAANTWSLNHPDSVMYESCVMNLLREIQTGATNAPCPLGVKLLAGSSPCQGFSTVNVKGSGNDLENRGLIIAVQQFVVCLQPSYAIFENVPGLISEDKNKISDFQTFLTMLLDVGYSVKCKILNALDYGCASERNRVILIASHSCVSNTPDWPLPTHPAPQFTSIRQTIGNLPSLTTASMGRFCTSFSGDVATDENHDTKRKTLHLYNHDTKVVPRALPYRRHYDDHFSAFLTNPLQCSATHPEEERLITIRELLRGMSYPDEYLMSYGHDADWYKQVGNSVPPCLAYNLARSIIHSRKQEETANN